jgi:transposase
VQGGSGRSAIAPEILFALWLYATTLEGVGSARAIARLTLEHDAYRWIFGGVSVNYHTLSDFRSAHGEVLDALRPTVLRHYLATAHEPRDPVQQGAVTCRKYYLRPS